MYVIIPGSLPPYDVAFDLGKLLLEYAPFLSSLLQFSSEKLLRFDPIEAGCSSFEAWKLKESGFIKKKNENLGSGLGPLLARDHLSHSFDPVWLGELGSLIVGNNQAKFSFDSERICFEENETKYFLNRIRPLLKESGFDVQYLCKKRCRLFLPKNFELISESPTMIVEQGLDLLRTKTASLRSWRRLLNDIQMVWYQDPLNEKRRKNGLPQINMIWPYGGAKPWINSSNSSSFIILEDLNQAYLNKDWNSWLDLTSNLDIHLRKILKSNNSINQPIYLLLFGARRQVILKVSNFKYRWIHKLAFPMRKKYWSSFWWSCQD